MTDKTFTKDQITTLTHPELGRMVHYKARGSADGTFPPICRAAIITTMRPDNGSAVGLAVLNPTGIFFDAAIFYDEDQAPGTWHWACGV